MNISKPTVNKLVAGLLILSALLAYFFSTSRALFERNRLPLPFGFRYCLPQEQGPACGKLQKVSSDAVQRLLATHGGGGPLILESLIFSPRQRGFAASLTGNGDIELLVNSASRIHGPRYTFSLKLKKGYNRITIRYLPPRDETPRLVFSISEELRFYRYILPGRPLSRALSLALSAADRLRSVIFVLVFFFLVLRMGLALFPIEPGPPVPEGGGSLHGLFRAFSFLMVFGPLAFYLNYALRFAFPDLWLILGGAVGAAGLFLSSFVRRRAVRADGRSVVVLALIVVLVFLHILIVSGSFLPPPSTQRSDLPNHLRLMQNYLDFGEILDSGEFEIYPQGLHAFMASVASRFGLPLQGSVIVYLVVVLIAIYFVVYLLSQELFGRIHYAYFFLALALSHLRFIYSRLFEVGQIPGMVALLFFFLSLYFLLKRDLVLSSIALASAVTTYPYYALFFALVILFAVVEWLKEPQRTFWQRSRRLILYFALPAFSASVYFAIYFAHGAAQHREGFTAWFKIDPFLSMKAINAVLMLAGLHFLLKDGKHRRALRIVLGGILGFLSYYVPYYFFGWGTTYYFMKNMQYVILLALPIEMVALTWIFRKLEKRRGAEYAILAGAAAIYILRIL